MVRPIGSRQTLTWHETIERFFFLERVFVLLAMSQHPPLTADAVVSRVLESGEFEELARSVMTELKRAGDLLHAEDDFTHAISQSARDGKLSQFVVGQPTDLQKQKKRAEVKTEIEKRLGNLAQIERKIHKTTDSSWINDSVHDCVHNAAKALMEEAEAKSGNAKKDSGAAEQPEAKKAKSDQ